MTSARTARGRIASKSTYWSIIYTKNERSTKEQNRHFDLLS